MIIAIFPNSAKKNSREITLGVVNFLKSSGVTVLAEDEEAFLLGAAPLSSMDSTKIDFLISLGGDGTILRLVHRYPEIQAPILAINLGSLGFMADTTIDNIEPSLKNLLDGNYTVRNRISMEGYTDTASNFAVNDIVIHRARNPGLIELAVSVDKRYLNTFSADGMILATPSGSTAYSLAAGGPILSPEIEAFILTPISPHTISNRPIVLLPEAEIHIEYISSQGPVEVTYDGFPSTFMATGDVLHVKRSSRLFRLVSMPDHDYFHTLRTKLGWTGKLRL